MTVFCHGHGNVLNMANLDEAKVDRLVLECKDDKFVHVPSQTEISLETIQRATCAQRQYPHIIREEKSNCSQGYGADGAPIEDLNDVVLVKVGWTFEHFKEQYTACIDERIFGTIWTHNIVLGKSICCRVKRGRRPPFIVDNEGKHRFYDFSDYKGDINRYIYN